jgi:hypothetical protein
MSDNRRVGVNSPNAHFEPHAVFHAKEKATAPADLVSLPPVSDARDSSGIEDFAEIGARFQLREFDYSAKGILDNEPCRLVSDEKRIGL